MMSTLMLVGIVLMVIGLWGSSVADAGEPGGRVVTLSSLCLLDTEEVKTREAVLERIRAAAQRDDPDLLVVPLTPFLSFREGHEAEDLKPFAELAAEHNTYLAVAMEEAGADERTYCTSVLLGRGGEIVGTYRKTHNLPDDKTALGDDLPVFETDFGILGFSLSTDITFPEVCAVERMKGA
ncbi:MAG: carbon-nitrogen hydrolase family protein, partial [Candidatus Latescibacteria bacterium]|nr:carbon-nitrogen hydrolase family protein [Candidatus Latescibacterota bacterium]